MWKYKPEYDTKETNEEQCFDCDYRLGEVPGIASFVNRICDNGNTAILMCMPEFYVSGTRSYKRRVRRKHAHPYIKVRKLDLQTKKIIGVCRISLVKPEYITGYNEDMKLSKEELDEFMDYIYNVDDNYALSGTKWARDPKVSTGWHRAISTYNNDCKVYRVRHHYISKTMGIPDYRKLLEEGT